MAQATGEFLLLLNSDAFVRPGALAAMLACLKAHPSAALVGPRLLNSDGSLQLSCFRFPSPIRCWFENLWIYAAIRHHPVLSNYQYWAHDSERAVDFVIGACLFVRRAVWDEIGGFDHRFFMYSEEIDWQRRMRQVGWQVIFTPAAKVVHLGGASGAMQRAQIKRRFFDSLDCYQWKHHGLGGLISMRMAMIAGCAMRAVLWTMVFLTSRGRRELARSKARLHCWLVWRQMTHWKLSFERAT
jgi:GT2 family glycosyltransferase